MRSRCTLLSSKLHMKRPGASREVRSGPTCQELDKNFVYFLPKVPIMTYRVVRLTG